VCKICHRGDKTYESSEDFRCTKGVRKYLIRTRGYRCEDCGLDSWKGKSLPLEVEHVNGLNFDNKEENVKLLCPNCHSLTPTWRGRNKGRYSPRERAIKE